MVFDNKLDAAKYRLYFNIILAVEVLLVVMYFITTVPFEKLIVKIGIASLLVTYLVLLVKKPMYFHLRDDGTNIVFRFYNLHPGFKKLKAIEIPKNQFSRFEVKSSFFGLRHDLLLYVKNGNSEFMYPPISVSINDKKMVGNIKRLLTAYLK